MNLHDPYTPILNALKKINCCDTDEKLLERLRLTRPIVKELRAAFSKCPCSVNYSSEITRAAYLLAYYPYYIELAHTELSKLPKANMPLSWDNESVAACFLGGGPCPEIIGWLAYVREHYPNIRSVKANIFDKYVDSWKVCGDITQSFVLPCYWKGQLEINSISCDLLNNEIFQSQHIIEAISNSNFFIMQNWLNDQPGTESFYKNHDDIINNIITMIKIAPSDSLFLLIDLNFPRVQYLFNEIGLIFKRLQLAEPIVSVSENRQSITPNIIFPELLNELFIGESGLIQKKHTRYYSIILKKFKYS